MYVYAPLRHKFLPTTSEALNAVKLAENETKPDPRPLLSILSRLPEEPRLMGLIQTRIAAVTGYEFEIVPSNAQDRRAVEIAAAVAERFALSGIPTHIDAILGALFYGLSALELDWQNVSGLGTMAHATPISSAELYLTRTGANRIVDSRTFETRPLEPADRYLVTTYNPLKMVRPNYIGGIIRSCMWLMIFKHFNWQDWAKFNEMFAQPTRWAQWKRAASEEDKSVARQAAEQIGADAWAAVSEDVEIKFIEAQRSGSIQAYKEFLAAVNDELAVLILGQTLTTEMTGSAGSRAAAEVHNLVRQDLTWADLRLIASSINRQYIHTDYRLNYGLDKRYLPKFKFLIDEPEDYESNARVLAEARAARVPLKKAEVYDKIGYSVPQPGDEVVE